MKKFLVSAVLLVLALAACQKVDPVSPVDPLPFPYDTNKDLSVQPGDDFYQYCNGAWLARTPVPATGTTGGMYDLFPVKDERVDRLVKEDPSLKRFFQLKDEMYDHVEASQAYMAGLAAKFPVPSSREELFRTLGKMITEGMPVIGLTLTLDYKEGKLIGLVSVSGSTYQYTFSEISPSIQTELGWIVEGMGMNPQDLYYNDRTVYLMNILTNVPPEEYAELMRVGFSNLYSYVSEQGLALYNMYHNPSWTKDIAAAWGSSLVGYELSYRFAAKYVSPELKQDYLDKVERLRDAFRARILTLDWMSETTRSNALEKLDKMVACVGYPDSWYEEFMPDLTGCETFVEAAHILKCSNFRLFKHLIGTDDLFSSLLTDVESGLNNEPLVTDLTLVNCFYKREYNAIVIMPAFMLPPAINKDVTEAHEYAFLSVAAHEITHGFDSEGSKYDATGRFRNWWTVADQMAFIERQEQLISCYNLLEYDPAGAPGMYTDGRRTLTENIADLGGFLIARDAYIARLQEQGYNGENYKAQLKKFYESYADLYCVQYSKEKLEAILTSDIHSLARLRVNGIVMNTDMWYDLYDVNRDNLLYLPPEKRTYIW